MGRCVVAVWALAVLVLPMEDTRGCRLDFAHVTAVLPDTFQVLATWTCGWSKALCWERYTQVGDKRIRSEVVCENDKATPTLEPMPHMGVSP